MGNKTSALPPPSPELTIPWRQVDCTKDEILHEVKDFNPSIKVLRIMLYGPTGAGKSSFVNSVQKVLLGRNAMSALENNTLTGASFTIKLNRHKLKKGRNELYPLEIVDIMGMQSTERGIQKEDVIKAFKGHILDEYEFNSAVGITVENPKYKVDPSLCDKVHCLVCILSADSISRMEDKVFEQMKDVRKSASLLGIPQVIVMTKVDKACEMVNNDLKKIYYSKKIKEKVDMSSGRVGIPLNAIYPVKNYADTISQDADTDMFILTALRDILNFANDFVECQLEKGEK